MFTNQAKADVYDQITNAIIAAIEAGAEKYEMPWHCLNNPVNATSRKSYRGVNVLMLWAAAQKLGYGANEWATYRQWQDAGAQVRKGERSTTVVFWKFFDRDEERQDEDDRKRIGNAASRAPTTCSMRRKWMDTPPRRHRNSGKPCG